MVSISDFKKPHNSRPPQEHSAEHFLPWLGTKHRGSHVQFRFMDHLPDTLQDPAFGDVHRSDGHPQVCGSDGRTLVLQPG